MRKLFSRCVTILLAIASIGNTAKLPPGWLNNVVAIGHTDKKPDRSSTWFTEGSGFFYGYLVKHGPDPTKQGYDVYLITNRHVIANHTQIEARLNPQKTSDQGEVFELPMTDASGKPLWFIHKDASIDVAGARVNWLLLQERDIDCDFFSNDVQAADTAIMKDIGVSAGDGVS